VQQHGRLDALAQPGQRTQQDPASVIDPTAVRSRPWIDAGCPLIAGDALSWERRR